MDYVRDNDPWTPAECSLLLKAFVDGVRINTLAGRHFRSPLTVELKLIELGVAEPYGGATVQEAEYKYLFAAEPGNERRGSDASSKRSCHQDSVLLRQQSEDIYDRAARLPGSWENGKRK